MAQGNQDISGFEDLLPDKPADDISGFEDLLDAQTQQSKTLKSQETLQDITNRWSQGLSHKILRGLTLGFSEHLPEPPEQTQQNIQQFEEEHPVMSGAAEVAGGVTSGLATGSAVARGAPQLSQWISRRVPNWAQLAGAGAGGGGVYAANVAEPGERTKAAVEGGLIGGVGGPIAGTALRLGVASAKGLVGALNRLFTNTSEKQATRILRSAIEREDLTPEFIEQELNRLGPEAVLADVSEGMARTARGAAAMDTGAHGIATKFLRERQTGQVGRLISAAGTEGFDAENYARGYSRWLRSRATQAEDAYREAYAAPLEATEGLVSIMDRPTVKDAMKVAVKNMADEGGGMGDVRFFQAVKEELDDKIGEALRAGRRNDARRLINIKKQLLDEIDEQVPAYKEAREIFAGEQQLKDAAEMGYEVVSRSNKDLWIIEEALEAMGESEQQAFRQGALRGIIDKLDKTREGRNVAQTMIDSRRARQLLGMVFPDDESLQRFMRTADAESTFSQTRNTVAGGSPTSRIDEDKLTLARNAGVAAAIAQGGDSVALALRLFKELGVGNPTPETLKIVAETLFSRTSRVGERAARRRTPPIGPVRQNTAYGVGGGVGTNAMINEVEE